MKRGDSDGVTVHPKPARLGIPGLCSRSCRTCSTSCGRGIVFKWWKAKDAPTAGPLKPNERLATDFMGLFLLWTLLTVPSRSRHSAGRAVSGGLAKLFHHRTLDKTDVLVFRHRWASWACSHPQLAPTRDFHEQYEADGSALLISAIQCRGLHREKGSETHSFVGWAAMCWASSG